jgi:hypothetical protein
MCDVGHMTQTACLIASALDRERLQAIVADRNRRQRHVERARVVLASADAGRFSGLLRPMVWRWQHCFAEAGVKGLSPTRPASPASRRSLADKAARMVALICIEPPHQATHWNAGRWPRGSVSRCARCNAFGRHTSRSRIVCVLSSARPIRPSRRSPPTSSASISVRRHMPRCSRSTNESKIRALDRTQPGPPIRPGRCQTITHDYKRHDTTILFAALSMLDGIIIDG